MFKPYASVKVEEITADAIEAALEKETGIDGWVESEDDLKKQIREGFIVLEGNTVTVYQDQFLL